VKKSIFIVMLLLLSSNVIADHLEDKAGITPKSVFWKLDMFFEKIHEKFDSSSFLEHQAERVAEARVMIQEGNSVGAEDATKLVKDMKQLEVIDNEYNKKFVVDDEVLNNVKDNINTALNSDFVHENILRSVKVLFMLKDYNNNLLYYLVTVEDWQITKIEKTDALENDYTHYILMSHGEFFALQHASQTSLAGHLSKIKVGIKDIEMTKDMFDGLQKQYRKTNLESVFCIYGSVNGNRYIINNIYSPITVMKTTTSIEYQRCKGSGLLGTLHSHEIGNCELSLLDKTKDSIGDDKITGLVCDSVVKIYNTDDLSKKINIKII
jgi:hypothetical protein